MAFGGSEVFRNTLASVRLGIPAIKSKFTSQMRSFSTKSQLVRGLGNFVGLDAGTVLLERNPGYRKTKP